MQCQTVLPGTECTFWGKQGCIFTDGSCQTVVENCEGCERIVTGSIGQVCSAYPAPAKKWNNGGEKGAQRQGLRTLTWS